MNELRVFDHEYFGEIRVVDIEGLQYFIGKDIAVALGYGNHRDALIRHVDIEDKADVVIPDGRQNRSVICINESGMYSLILSSKLPSAKKFKQWVTSEVLPSVRKHGAYMTKETVKQAMSDPDFMIQMLQTLKDEQEAHTQTRIALKETENKLIEVEEEIDQFIETKNLLSMDTISLNLGIGKVALYRWLRDNKILKLGEYEYRGKKYKTEEYNMPYYAYTKYFDIKYRMYNTQRYPLLCMTAVGQVWLYKLLVKERVIKKDSKIEARINLLLKNKLIKL